MKKSLSSALLWSAVVVLLVGVCCFLSDLGEILSYSSFSSFSIVCTVLAGWIAVVFLLCRSSEKKSELDSLRRENEELRRQIALLESLSKK